MLLERARRIIAEARKSSGPTTEIIKASPESLSSNSDIDVEEQFRKNSDDKTEHIKTGEDLSSSPPPKSPSHPKSTDVSDNSSLSNRDRVTSKLTQEYNFAEVGASRK